MLKHALTAAALAAVLATPAFAQKQPAPDTTRQMQASPDKGMNKDMKSGAAPHGAMSNPKESRKGDMAATDAHAQSAAFMQSQEPNEWRASKLIGASVYGPDDKSIGDINDVLIDKDGQVTAVVVGVGGFLGVGEKNVALSLQALDVHRKDGAIDKITVSYTKDQLKDAPTFAYYDGKQTETTGMKADESAGTPMAPHKSDSKMMPDKTYGKPQKK